MSTDDQNSDDTDQPLGELVDALSDVDETSSDAEQNATTISDNNGGRIELDQKPTVRVVLSRQSVLNQDDKVIRLVKKKPDKIILTVRKKRIDN